jgi:sugar phosphate isomerase/epimerase
MKLALDPNMIRFTPLLDLPAEVAELGYQYIELSPRDDFLPFFLHPRVNDSLLADFKKALSAAQVEIASVLPLYRWSGPDEEERQAAVRYWKRAVQITVDLGVDVMVSEFNGRPELAERSEDIGAGDVPWDEFFGTLGAMQFDGIATVCVFSEERRAHESMVSCREQVEKHTGSW